MGKDPYPYIWYKKGDLQGKRLRILSWPRESRGQFGSMAEIEFEDGERTSALRTAFRAIPKVKGGTDA